MSNRETQYLEECGTCCPECRNPYVTIKELFDGPNEVGDQMPEVIVRCSCMHCGAKWTETYTLTKVNLL